MITKQRLTELIEQGATIWNDDWEEIKLDKGTCEICELQYLNGEHWGWCLQFQYDYEDERHRTEVNLEDLEEDIEKGRWELEMTATRTEILKLPTWEEVKNNGFDYTFFIKKDDMDFEYYFLVAEIDRTVEVMFRQIEHCMTSSAYDIIFNEPLTKENYIEACKLCLRLFRGEEV